MTESGMRTIFQLNDPQKQESDTLDTHDPELLFLNTLVKMFNNYQNALKSLSELE